MRWLPGPPYASNRTCPTTRCSHLPHPTSGRSGSRKCSPPPRQLRGMDYFFFTGSCYTQKSFFLNRILGRTSNKSQDTTSRTNQERERPQPLLGTAGRGSALAGGSRQSQAPSHSADKCPEPTSVVSGDTDTHYSHTHGHPPQQSPAHTYKSPTRTPTTAIPCAHL